MENTVNEGRFSILPYRAVIDSDLNETDFRVLATIGLFLNRQKEGWPMQSTLADMLGKSQPTVARSIKRLEASGYIRSRKKFEGRPGTHKVYQVVFDEIGMSKNDNSGTIKFDDSGYSPKERISGYSPKERISHKNSPVEHPNNNMFEEAWKLYCSTRLKANQQKKPAKAEWPRAVKRAGSEQKILDAIQIEIFERTNMAPGEFVRNLPAMHRWLKGDQWNDALERGSPSKPSANETERLVENLFIKLAMDGEWAGARYDLKDPRQFAEYPPELYEKHGIQRPGDLV